MLDYTWIEKAILASVRRCALSVRRSEFDQMRRVSSAPPVYF
jgi:hypothetical protein